MSSVELKKWLNWQWQW